MANNTQLLSYITQYLPDNTSQLIDPADLRYVLAAMVQAKASIEDLDNFAQLAGARFIGSVELPTAPVGTNSEQAASTAFVQAALAAIASGKNLSELVLPQDVAAGNWYMTTDGFWEARRSFTATAAPTNGPNWRLVASFTGQLTSISAANITDATDAGRQMLLAPTAAAQRALVGNPRITAGQYGNHPAFASEDGVNGLFAWLIKAVLALSGAQVIAAPAAPTAGQVDDTADTFSFLVNPAYPSFSQYKVNGLPGVTGAVVLDATNSYVAGGRIYIKVVGAVAKGGLAVYVAGSGNVPDGTPLVSDAAFTGAAVVTPPPVTTAALTAGLAIAVASIMAGNPLTFTVTAGGGSGGYTYAVMATSTTTGTSVNIGSAASGSWTPTRADDYDITATITDSAGASKTSPVRALHVTPVPVANQLPTANAGADNVLAQGVSSVQLAGSGFDADGTIATYSWSQSSGPVSAAFNSKTVAQPAVSGLTTAGTYTFQLIVTDNQGGVSLADEVVVTVPAVTPTGPVVGTPGDGDYSDGAGIKRVSAEGYIVRAAGASLRRMTNAASTTVRVRATGNYANANFTVVINGTPTTYRIPVGESSGKDYVLSLPGSGTTTVKVVLGDELRGNEVGDVQGVEILSFTEAAGSTSSFVPPAKAPYVVIVDGNSISNEYGATNPMVSGNYGQMRSQSQDITILNYGSAQAGVQLAASNRTAKKAQLAAASSGYGDVRYLMTLGTNDRLSTAQMSSLLLAHLQWIHATYPTWKVGVISCLPRTDESSVGTPAIRQGQQDACGQYGVFFYDGSTLFNPSTSTIDGVHPNQATYTALVTPYQYVVNNMTVPTGQATTNPNNYPTTAGTIPLSLSKAQRSYMQMKGTRDYFADTAFVSIVTTIAPGADFSAYPCIFGRGRQQTGEDTTFQCYILPNGHLEVDFHSDGDGTNAAQHVGFDTGYQVVAGQKMHIMIAAAKGDNGRVWVNGAPYVCPTVLTSTLHKSTQPLNIGVASQGASDPAPTGSFIDMSPIDFLAATFIPTQAQRDFIAGTDNGNKRVGQIGSSGLVNFSTPGMIGYSPLLGFTNADAFYTNLVDTNRAFGLEIAP